MEEDIVWDDCRADQRDCCQRRSRRHRWCEDPFEDLADWRLHNEGGDDEQDCEDADHDHEHTLDGFVAAGDEQTEDRDDYERDDDSHVDGCDRRYG